MLTGILFVLRSGIPWRMLPEDEKRFERMLYRPGFRRFLAGTDWAPGILALTPPTGYFSGLLLHRTVA